MKLTLLRHGQTPSNVLGLLDTAPPGPGLTDLGRLQAGAVPQALHGEPVDAVFASTQLRAQQTAKPLALARDLDVRISGGLREIAAGELEMRSDPDAVHRYMGTVRAWLEGDLRRRIPAGPSGVEVLERFDAAVAEMATLVGDGAVVAVSHGAMIRVWATLRATNLSDMLGARQHLDNTGAVVLDGAPGRLWRAVSWTEQPIGGDRLADRVESGPAGEAVGPAGEVAGEVAAGA